jgi:hypothetical protein
MTVKTKIAIKKLNGIIVDTEVGVENRQLALSLSAEMMKLGYAPSEQLFNVLQASSSQVLARLHGDVIPVLKSLKGDDVVHNTFYPNFPRQVMEASSCELFWNAILHYWTEGSWRPKYEKLPREYAFEATKFRELDLVTELQFDGVFNSLLSSRDSLSDEDKGYIEWFIKNRPELDIPDTIPFKETMCIVAGLFLKKELDIEPLVKTATDVLRIITYLNGGDVSLAENTKFKSMKRSQRRYFSKILEKVASEEDIQRHRNKWTKLFHSLHVGDYSKSLFAMAKKIRNNERILTFNGRVQEGLEKKDLDVVTLLMKRPGDFARKLDHVLRTFPKNQDGVLMCFNGVVDQIGTKVLTQVLGHLGTRHEERERIIFPKGSVQKAQVIPALKKLSPKTVDPLMDCIRNSLKDRFSKLEPLGKVYIDPELMLCPIPSQQRSASEGTFSVARGTRLDIGDNGTLRFFIYWVGRDIDLSATMHNDSFDMIEQISYTNLRSRKYKACHSGDITSAPHGASEFIDIDIDSALKHGARYIAMNVLVYSGPTFKEHEACYAGWMTRSEPGSNEIYDPKTVEQKIDLNSQTKNSIPVVFDLKERKAIWTDLSTGRNVTWYGGNNIHSNAANIRQTMEAIVEARSKMSLYELFELHAQGRGEIVENKEDADTVFSLTEGTTPFDINVISSEFIV